MRTNDPSLGNMRCFGAAMLRAMYAPMLVSERVFKPKRCVLATSLAVAQIGLAYAQTTPPSSPPPAAGATTQVQAQAQAQPADGASTAAPAKRADDETPLVQDRVVITGTTSLRRTVRESSVAVTVADRDVLDRKAPRSTASALELVPGIFVEDSGGEVSNNFSVRGLAGGAQSFIQLQEDGLPIFYTNALADTILKQELFIDRMEAVRGGTSGILTVNGAGATINFITFKNKDAPEGAFRLTMSDYNTRRFDMRYGGALGGGWFGGIGGFYRSSDSVRDTGFTADHGGMVRGYLGRKIEGGEWSVNIKLVDDHNTFLLPIPLQGVNKPGGIPGLDPNFGTMLGPDNAVMRVLTSPGTGAGSQVNDATDGVATNATAIGYSFEKALAKDFTLRSKGRYTTFKNDFNSVFSFDNASLVPAVNRLNLADNADVAAMIARFGGTPALRVTSTGQVLSGAAALNALNGNGLVATSITAKNKRYVDEFVNDAAVTWTTPDNSLTVGWLAFDTHVRKDQNIGATAFLTDVRNNARRMDIVAIDANQNVLGFLTDNSILQYGAWGEGTNFSQSTSNSIYVNDEYKVNDRLRFDAGLRYERYRFRGYSGIGIGTTNIPGAFDANGNDVDNVMANNQFAGAFGGQYQRVEGSFSEPSWTVGSNYLINDNMAVYGRFAHSYQANNQNPVTKINFAELGLRYQARGIAATLTAFRTNYKDFRFSRRFGADTEDTVASSDIDVNGLEFEVDWRPVRWAGVNMTGVVQHSGFNIKSVSGPSPGQLTGNFDGNRPERTPNINFTITPTYYMPDGRGQVSLSYHRVGDRFADIANTLKLPAYNVLDLAVRYELTPSISLNASIQNLTNTIGLTEGNPRAGFVENPGVSNFFYARPILGRNANLSVTMQF